MTSAVDLEPGAPSDVDLMLGIQSGEADALSQLYDRYNGIMRALILRIIHNEDRGGRPSPGSVHGNWNQAKNFSAEKGRPLGWMVTLTRRRAIDALRKKTGLCPRRRASPSGAGAATPCLGGECDREGH